MVARLATRTGAGAVVASARLTWGSVLTGTRRRQCGGHRSRFRWRPRAGRPCAGRYCAGRNCAGRHWLGVLAGAGPAFATGTVVLTTGLVLALGSVVGEVEALFERTSFAVW